MRKTADIKLMKEDAEGVERDAEDSRRVTRRFSECDEDCRAPRRLSPHHTRVFARGGEGSGVGLYSSARTFSPHPGSHLSISPTLPAASRGEGKRSGRSRGEGSMTSPSPRAPNAATSASIFVATVYAFAGCYASSSAAVWSGCSFTASPTRRARRRWQFRPVFSESAICRALITTAILATSSALICCAVERRWAGWWLRTDLPLSPVIARCVMASFVTPPLSRRHRLGDSRGAEQRPAQSILPLRHRRRRSAVQHLFVTA